MKFKSKKNKKASNEKILTKMELKTLLKVLNSTSIKKIDVMAQFLIHT